MTRHILKSGIFAALFLACLSVTCFGSSRRETPAVKAIQRAQSAVVNIHTEKTAPANESLFSSGKPRKVNGMGTGIIIDERGYIVTNYHVIADVDTLRVSLHDGSTYDGQVVSYDRSEDLAIIKINASKKLDLMPLGTSSDLMLAETVIAVGNAFGYEDSVTLGIVSSLSRDVEVNEEQAYENLIQTDASINPGNSGGPLINLDGEIVGINVAIRAGAQRIGFAIPIDDAREVIAKLLSIEHLCQTRHGLITRDIKSGTTRLLRVEGAAPDSPAEAAGFQPGDVVVQVGTVDIVDGADFERALLGRPAGEKVDVLIRRDEVEEHLTLELAPVRPSNFVEAGSRIVRANNNDETTAEKAWRMLGMRLRPLPAEHRSELMPPYRGGMKILQVRPGSAAAKNGIREGDVLVGLHLWETISYDNLTYVIDHPQLTTFNPLKFYIVRGRETLYGHMPVSLQD